jgi:hypothetical protein
MTQQAINLWVLGVLLLLILVTAFGPTFKAHRAEAAPTFIAFYFLLLGLRLLIGSSGDEGGLFMFLGAFFASLPLTYFWLTRKRGP